MKPLLRLPLSPWLLERLRSSSGTSVEEIADQAVVGDLEDRRLLVLVDGHDDLAVLHAGQDAGWRRRCRRRRRGRARRSCRSGRPASRSARSRHRRRRGTRRRRHRQLSASCLDDLEILGRADAATAGDDDPRRAQVGPVAGLHFAADEPWRGRPDRRPPTVSTAAEPPVGGSRIEGRRANGDDALGVVALDRGQRIAGIDVALERRGRDDLDDVAELRRVEQCGHPRHDVAAERGRSGQQMVVVAGHGNEQWRQVLGHRVGVGLVLDPQHLVDACTFAAASAAAPQSRPATSR